MERTACPRDLTDAQWAVWEPPIPLAKPDGRLRTVDIREVPHGRNSWLRTGCAWRFLPHDLSPWGTVHSCRWRWQRDGAWPAIPDALRTKAR